jgi:hypothetical protein
VVGKLEAITMVSALRLPFFQDFIVDVKAHWIVLRIDCEGNQHCSTAKR